MGNHERVIVAAGRFAPLIDYGLRHILREDGSLRAVGFNLDPEALAVVVAQYAVQVVVLDETSVPGSSVIARLRAESADIGVLVLAQQPTRAYCLRALGLGATACLSKTAPASDIVSAVRLAAEGKHLLAPVRGPSASVGSFLGLLSLTSRERAVLELLSAGQSNAEVALELHITIETARTHVAHIFRKLGVNARRELIGVALPKRDASARTDGSLSHA